MIVSVEKITGGRKMFRNTSRVRVNEEGLQLKRALGIWLGIGTVAGEIVINI